MVGTAMNITTRMVVTVIMTKYQNSEKLWFELIRINTASKPTGLVSIQDNCKMAANLRAFRHRYCK